MQEVEEEEDVGPGTYEHNIRIRAGQKQKRSHYFKSKSKRTAFPKKKSTIPHFLKILIPFS